MFTSAQMQELQLIRLRPGSKTELASRLRLDPASLDTAGAGTGGWIAAQLPLGNLIDAREASWTVRMLNSHLSTSPNTNLIIVRLNTPGGEIDACLTVASALADLDPRRVRTVAYVETAARGPA